MIPPLTKWINDIKVKLGFSRTMTAAGADVVDAVNKQSDQIANVATVITATTNNSGHAISSGEYFIANGAKYKASATIDTGATWSDKSTSVSDHDIINVLNSKITKNVVCEVSTSPDNDLEYFAFKITTVGNIANCYLHFHIKNGTTNKALTFTNIIPDAYKPIDNVYATLSIRNNNEIKPIYIDSTGGGTITIDNVGTRYAGEWCGSSFSYIF